MTNFTKNMMIAAGALCLAAGIAGAQTLQVEIPFGFRVAGTALPAGSYRVVADTQKSGTEVLTLTSRDTQRSVLTVPASTGEQPGNSPALTFECSGSACALVQVAPGDGGAYRLSTPSLGKDGNTRIAVIRAALVKNR
jgi:hypothetical protein